VARKYATCSPDWRVDGTYVRIRGRGTTFIAPSTDTDTSWTPKCRRRAMCLRARVLRAGNRFQRYDATSIITERQPAIRQRWPRRCWVLHGLVGIVRTASSATTGSKRTAASDACPQVVASAAIFTRGHALMRNIRHGFYRSGTPPAAAGFRVGLEPTRWSSVISRRPWVINDTSAGVFLVHKPTPMQENFVCPTRASSRMPQRLRAPARRPLYVASQLLATLRCKPPSHPARN